MGCTLRPGYQCDHIWQNFASLAKNQSIWQFLWVFISIRLKIDPGLWVKITVWQNIHAIGQIFMVLNGQNLYRYCSHLVPLLDSYLTAATDRALSTFFDLLFLCSFKKIYLFFILLTLGFQGLTKFLQIVFKSCFNCLLFKTLVEFYFKFQILKTCFKANSAAKQSNQDVYRNPKVNKWTCF